MTPMQWEEHCGRKSYKNWRMSIKICADPEVPGAPNVSTWECSCAACIRCWHSSLLATCFLSCFVQRTMFAWPWLESFGWGTDQLVSPEEIYPAVTAEEAAKLPASSGTRDEAKRGQAEGEPQHEAEMEAPSAAATAELAVVTRVGEGAAEGPPLQDGGASQEEARPAAQVFKPICLAVIAWVLTGSSPLDLLLLPQCSPYISALLDLLYRLLTTGFQAWARVMYTGSTGQSAGRTQACWYQATAQRLSRYRIMAEWVQGDEKGDRTCWLWPFYELNFFWPFPVAGRMLL